jgi:hypothetical protein
MTKFVFSTVLCAAIVLAPQSIASAEADYLSGFTLKQLNTAIEKSGIANQELDSILTFRDLGDAQEHIAILSSSRSGWHVTVLHSNLAEGLEVEWKSGKLHDDFSASSSDALEIDDLGDEQVVVFSGCAPHNCGGVDGVFGMVLYAPRVKQAFFAHYDYDDRKPRGSFGSLDFSSNTTLPVNDRYKAALQSAIKKKLGM